MIGESDTSALQLGFDASSVAMRVVRWLRLGALSIALGCLLLAARGPLLSAQEPELLAVTSVDGQGATLYAEPSTAADAVALLPDGSFVWVAGPPTCWWTMPG